MPFAWRYLLKVSPEIPLQSVLHSSSHQAEEINHVTNYFFITAAGILLIVILLTAYVLYKFRENKRQSSLKPLSKKWEQLNPGAYIPDFHLDDMAFPRLNAFSFWITFFEGLLLYFIFKNKKLIFNENLIK